MLGKVSRIIGRALGGVTAGALWCGLALAQNCEDPQCERHLSARCLERLGAGSTPAGEECAAENDAYVGCLRKIASDCGRPAPQSAGECSAEDARKEWDLLRKSDDIDALEVMAEFCGDTLQGRLAASRARKLKAAKAAGGAPAGGKSASGAAGATSSATAEVAVRPVGVRANSRLSGARNCSVPDNAALALDAWTLQVRTGGFGSRYLVAAGPRGEGRDDFVGLEYLETSNGWFRFRNAAGEGHTMFRGGQARSQKTVTKRVEPKPVAVSACAHYRWGAFDIDLSASKIQIRYVSGGFQYDDETLSLDRRDGRAFRFAGETHSLR